jgi:hypothetical protein
MDSLAPNKTVFWIITQSFALRKPGSMRSFEPSVISFEGYNQPNLDYIRSFE